MDNSTTTTLQSGLRTLYEKLLTQYPQPHDQETMQSLNVLCMRLAFCFYADDAGLLTVCEEAERGHALALARNGALTVSGDGIAYSVDGAISATAATAATTATAPAPANTTNGQAQRPLNRNQLHDYFAGVPVRHARALLQKLFEVLNTPQEKRDPLEEEVLLCLPYIDGALFAGNDIKIPRLTEEIMELLVNKAGTTDKWSELSPTLFGELFESTLSEEMRRIGGMHYTSIDNIHKLIDPLFLDDLKEAFATIKNANWDVDTKVKELFNFQDHLASLTFLDPACGSGNFLTETYLCLRRLENDVISEIKNLRGFEFEINNQCPVKVSMAQFLGIEINHFAVTIAKAALWIAERRMAQETAYLLPQVAPSRLLLNSYPNIRHGNALQLDWHRITHGKLSYIIGNPPFVGARKMSSEQKQDVLKVFTPKWRNVGNLDYVCCWFKKAAEIMAANNHIRTAFVATNSLCQGESVANLWGPLCHDGIEITFAHSSFIWHNGAASQANVVCIIVGMQHKPQAPDYDQDSALAPTGHSILSGSCLDAHAAHAHPQAHAQASSGSMLFGGMGTAAFWRNKPKRIYTGKEVIEVSHINGYLQPAPDVFIQNRQHPLCEGIPEGGIGNKPIDGGHFLFTPDQYDSFIQQEPKSQKYFKKWIGAEELLYSKERFCLYLGNCPEEELAQMPMCQERVRLVSEYRNSAKRGKTRSLDKRPTGFPVENMPNHPFLVIPEVSSSHREYIPIDFITEDVLCSNKLKLFLGASLYHFSVLSSSVHMAWVRAVSGRLKMDFSYSLEMVFNNFPWPYKINTDMKVELERAGQEILKARDDAQHYKHELKPYTGRGISKNEPGCLAQLYEPSCMPEKLRQAHALNDKLVLQAYGLEPDTSETQILNKLFELFAFYEDLERHQLEQEAQAKAAEAQERALRKEQQKLQRC